MDSNTTVMSPNNIVIKYTPGQLISAENDREEIETFVLKSGEVDGCVTVSDEHNTVAIDYELMRQFVVKVEETRRVAALDPINRARAGSF